MIYISLSDFSVEIIQTKKKLWGGEKIIASVRREMPEGLVTNGLIADVEKFTIYLRDILSSAYPNAIEDKNIAISISDSQVIHGRFLIETGEKNLDVTKLIINEAKKILPEEAINFEHFYKTIKISQNSQEILYTAISRNTIIHFAKILESIGAEINFLSSKTFSLFELFKEFIGKDDFLIYCDLDKKIEYYCYDQYGPTAYFDKKFNSKSFITDTKEIIDKLKEEKKIKVTKIILGGLGSLEIHANEIYESYSIPTIKIGEIIDKILIRHKIKFDPGGTSSMLFTGVIGLFLLGKNKTAPNFARDIEIIKKDQSEILSSSPLELEKDAKKTEEKVTKPVKKENIDEIEQMTVAEKTFFTPTNDLIKEKESVIFSFLKSKLFIILVSGLLIFGLIWGVILITGKNNSNFTLPFISSPSPTPLLPTLTPTVSPTPTIDPNLKRDGIKISVQNGTEKTGYAKETASYLEEKGYKNVAKGNADKNDYEETVIKIKDASRKYLPLLLLDLKDKLTISKTESLENDNKYDVIIILGNK